MKTEHLAPEHLLLEKCRTFVRLLAAIAEIGCRGVELFGNEIEISERDARNEGAMARLIS